MTNLDAIRAAALAWHDAGVCVLPTAGDGSKRPGVGSWTQYQGEQYPRTNLAATNAAGIGLVCGAISGGLEMLELEGRAVAEGALGQLDELVTAAGLTGLWLRLTADPGAYIERTPSGGLHILYRLADAQVPGNTALARRPATEAELAVKKRERVKVLAETRGEGGYVVVAPSQGTTHPTGQPWEVIIGTAGEVPTITAAEREQLHRLFRSLDRLPEPERKADAPRVPRPRGDGTVSPGDAFAAQVDWSDVLEPQGWTEVHRPGGGQIRYWRRPDKAVGISATTNARGTDRFHNFSSSAWPFDAEQSYSKFGAYALLNHGGDHSAAARELARQGYGTPTTSNAAAEQRAAIADLTGSGDRGTTMDAQQWDDPLPLGWPTKLPPFPMDALPGIAGRYAHALAIETQTPPDLAGVVVVGTLAACTGGRVRIIIRRGWVEPTNLFAIPVLAPGSRKSAVVSACEAPIDSAERRLLEEMAPRIREAAIQREILDKYAEQAKSKASREASPALIAEAQAAAAAAAAVEVPAWPRLLADDATPEAFVGLLAEQGGRLTVMSAEAGIFDSLIGRYGKDKNLDPLLKAHAGDSIRVDRKTRGPERVDRPALTVIASIQPYALRETVSRQEFAGRGLLARVLWSLPADLVGYRDENAPPVPEDLTAAYRQFVEDLAVDMAKRDTVVHLSLTEQAYKVLIEYMRQVEVMLRADGPLGASRLIKDWGSKLVGAVARIAGGLHIAATERNLDEPISEATMASAVRLGEYFRAHAVAALSTSEDKRIGEGRKVLEVAVAKDMTAFTMRELARRMPRGQQSADQLAKTLGYLVELGWARPGGKGWEIHPRTAQMLNAADSADNADTDCVSAGQRRLEAPAATVSTTADSADNWGTNQGTVSAVSATADTRAGTSAPILSSANMPLVSAVSAVSTNSGLWPENNDTCPACGWGMTDAPHIENCEATR